MSVDVMSWVWRHSKQDGTALLLLLAIADSCNADGECWPSVATLARKARISERQTTRLIGQLIAAGELRVVAGGGRGRSSRYLVPFEIPEAGKGVTDDTLSGGKGVKDVTLSGPERVTSRAGTERKGDIQGHGFKGEEPLEICEIEDRIPVVPPELQAFDGELRECAGYDPNARFYEMVLQRYGGVLDLEEEAIRIRGWFTDPKNRKARGRVCNRGFVLGWLGREKNRLEGRGTIGEAKRPHVVGRGLDRFG